MVERVRRNVWTMRPEDLAIVWYKKAVVWLVPKPAEATSSWRHLAFIHGVPATPMTLPMQGGMPLTALTAITLTLWLKRLQRRPDTRASATLLCLIAPLFVDVGAHPSLTTPW